MLKKSSFSLHFDQTSCFMCGGGEDLFEDRLTRWHSEGANNATSCLLVEGLRLTEEDSAIVWVSTDKDGGTLTDGGKEPFRPRLELYQDDAFRVTSCFHSDTET